ncbi:uncharacterized protein [Rutidosis leptorrhynchoides]|uniref:uncharacterized protein n=1 Tax=Rutidosis leptorrhynchoides TaxID=125765 RepID=UPI003A99207B
MVNRIFVEAMDCSMRDICRQDNPDSMDTLFWGKIVVFGGNFRQILPVIQKGKIEDIVAASLNSSYLWDHVTILKLTVNMRLCDSICASRRDADFNTELYTTDFPNSIEVVGLPKHNLRLKVGVPVMLLRNIDQAGGLCNGTPLQIVYLVKKIIKAKNFNQVKRGEDNSFITYAYRTAVQENTFQIPKKIISIVGVLCNDNQ